MDQGIRNSLRGVVTQCRKLLEEAVRHVLQGQFGIYETGKRDEVHVEDEERMKNLSDEDKGYRRDVQAHLGHIQALGYKAKDALAQLVREIAFTHLNRLCAYKMMEAREVWVGGQRFRESVSRGMKSQGFQFYLADHAEDKKLFDTGHQDVAYRHFLGWLGALLSEEIGVLFSPTDPANRLFPPQRVLDDVLALLNSDDLNGIWTEDETIGWVYQYFTPKELRDQVRKESAAPRNSYELAFRNQFFTPRYVVEFLTDNTLGRIWYEMRRGDTKLKDQCCYMVRRPSEVFLAEGQMPAGPTPNQDELSQEELLKQPIYISHRPKKDPRELPILDPACGSGHFLLYCFDLLLTIYDEAYADPNLGPTLNEDYPTLEALRRDVPRLILVHNLHGIDIDLRCTQIAALALWLRCQRAYREMGLKQDRPKITKSNIVCAEPMPGENEMLKEFVAQLQPKLLGQLVEVVFDKMKLAGEAGSLLKIEEELRDAISDAKRQWVAEYERAKDRRGRPLFFSQAEMERAATKTPQPQLFDFSEITDEQFWNEAESQVLGALREYAHHAANGGRLQRQLFADDAEQGLAFIDICQKRFDVVLMNPPFGGSSKAAKGYMETLYPLTKNDLYTSFVERGLSHLYPRGLLGAITSRTGFFVTSFEKWRKEILLHKARPTVFADLGYGVLDSAMVETAAYCIESHDVDGSTTFIRLLNVEEKREALESALEGVRNGQPTGTYCVDPASFKQVPGSPFAYWVSDRVLQLFSTLPSLGDITKRVCMGLSTKSDFQFLRLVWETPIGSHGSRWFNFVKGGDYSPFYSTPHLVVDWENDGARLKTFSEQRHLELTGKGGWSRWINNWDSYFQRGLTWSRRSQIGLSVRVLPDGCIFSDKGPAVIPEDAASLPRLLGICNSRPFKTLVSIQMAFGAYEVGVLHRTPVPDLSGSLGNDLGITALQLIELKRSSDTATEVSSFFQLPALLQMPRSSLADCLAAWRSRETALTDRLQQLQSVVDNIAFTLYGIEECDDFVADERTTVNDPVDLDASDSEDDSEPLPINGESPLLVAGILSYLVGTILGRWDVRLASGERPIDQSPDPFGPLPSLSPGMLQPAISSQPSHLTEYPLNIDSNGIIPDDPDHTDDIVRRVREVLELIWQERAEAIEKEACEILGVQHLRDYFRKPGKGGFWDDHVARYSKSRRKAPIYWLLQSSKKNYGLWLYYHRLDKDILFKARQHYVDPKIRLEQTRLDSLRSQKTALEPAAKGAKKIDKDIERQETLLSELKDFAEKLERAAKLNFGKQELLDSNVQYDPDLNDGVVLNIAPLWELVPWKEAKNYWEELLEGKYEWSSMGKLLRKKGLVK